MHFVHVCHVHVVHALSVRTQDMIEFLKEDLQHLFDDQGIDASKYDDVVV